MLISTLKIKMLKERNVKFTLKFLWALLQVFHE